jgi:hypothetical protein
MSLYAIKCEVCEKTKYDLVKTYDGVCQECREQTAAGSQSCRDERARAEKRRCRTCQDPLPAARYFKCYTCQNKLPEGDEYQGGFHG